MEKPIKPKKPQKPKLDNSQCERKILFCVQLDKTYYFLEAEKWDEYGRPLFHSFFIKSLSSEEKNMYESCDESDKEDWYFNFWFDVAVTSYIKYDMFVQCSEQTNIPIENLAAAHEIYDDNYRGQVVFETIVYLSEEEKEKRNSQYEKDLQFYHNALEQYHNDLITFREQKAKYDVWLATQKLNALKGFKNENV